MKGSFLSYHQEVYNGRRTFEAHLQEISGEKGIRAQLKELVAGGNDASAYQRAAAGARVLALSAPVRYIHSACSVAKIDDLEQVYALANALAERSFDK